MKIKNPVKIVLIAIVAIVIISAAFIYYISSQISNLSLLGLPFQQWHINPMSVQYMNFTLYKNTTIKSFFTYDFGTTTANSNGSNIDVFISNSPYLTKTDFFETKNVSVLPSTGMRISYKFINNTRGGVLYVNIPSGSYYLIVFNNNTEPITIHWKNVTLTSR